MYSDFALIDTPLSVSEINLLIKKTFEERFFNLSVSGEISSFRPSGNGHWYFTLKDEKSQISAVMFRSMQFGLDFRPKDGDAVTVTGNIDVYSPRGTYQIICQSMKKAGEGELLAELEKRRSYYEGLGWFDQRKKKKLPEIPKVIGVVTAATGAAIQDILNTTRKRAPGTDIILYEALVQGEKAAAEIASAIIMANSDKACDVLIVGRGGGSTEDLLPFSDPLVIEAIHNSEIPVISAVGHEIDWAISDDVADRRAITPTDGAVIATEGIFNRREKLKSLNEELSREMHSRLLEAEKLVPDISYLRLLMEKRTQISLPSEEELKRILVHRRDSAELRLSYAEDSILDSVGRRYRESKTRISTAITEARRLLPLLYRTREAAYDTAIADLKGNSSRQSEKLLVRLDASVRESGEAVRLKLARAEGRCEMLIRELEALNPKNVLSRGYAIVEREDGFVLTKAKDTRKGDRLVITLKRGRIGAVAEGEIK